MRIRQRLSLSHGLRWEAKFLHARMRCGLAFADAPGAAVALEAIKLPSGGQ